ncbi:MAG: c-type cytochrome biogenesis protein CcmI, partial [Pseudomonadota bacterium]
KANFLAVLATDQAVTIGEDDKVEPATVLAQWQEIVERFPDEADVVEFANQRIATLSGDVGPAQPGPTAEQVEDAADMSTLDRMAMIEGMVGTLAARLAENADDLSGWERLIRSYIVLERDEEARQALATARKTFADDESALQTLAAFDAQLAVTN